MKGKVLLIMKETKLQSLGKVHFGFYHKYLPLDYQFVFAKISKEKKPQSIHLGPKSH